MPDSIGPCSFLTQGLRPREGDPRARDSRSPSSGSLPSFLSSSPPRSEGEALLRRIFSPGARM